MPPHTCVYYFNRDIVEMAVHHALGAYNECIDIFGSNGCMKADSRFDVDRVRAFVIVSEHNEDYNDYDECCLWSTCLVQIMWIFFLFQ